MFLDQFLPNLAIFVAAQLVAWLYLRTGLVPVGISTIVVTWVTADAALVARFGFDHRGAVYVAALVLMQVWTVLAGMRFAIGRWRRSRPAFLAARETSFREAFLAWLRDDLDAALGTLRGLTQRDPWDLTSRLLLGKVLLASGSGRGARRQFLAARRLDLENKYEDVFRAELAAKPDGGEDAGKVAAVPESVDPSPA